MNVSPCPFCGGQEYEEGEQCPVCHGTNHATREEVGDAMLAGRRTVYWARQDTIKRPAEILADDACAHILADQTLRHLRPVLEAAFLAMVRRVGTTRLLIRMGLHHTLEIGRGYDEDEPEGPAALPPRVLALEDGEGDAGD